MGWSPDGKHIALLTRDDYSLWQIAYPGLDNLEQLTAAMPELKRPTPKSNLTKFFVGNVVWSADGTALAFIGAGDVYIVHVDNTP
jgi:Tol biopolymer transport system component